MYVFEASRYVPNSIRVTTEFHTILRNGITYAGNNFNPSKDNKICNVSYYYFRYGRVVYA